MTDLSALDGLRVIDLSRVLGGPYCSQILGDHGAEVLKIEPPQGDETRGWGPPFHNGLSAYFINVNRNKIGLTLDLSNPEGREALLELLEGADVLLENFKPGTLEKWGLGPELLEARFPRLIHCRVSGFGADGPLGGLPGYDAAIQAASGLMSINGSAEGGPVRLGVPLVDMVTGLNAAIGILLALQERARSGRGQFVESALYDCALSVLHPHSANYIASGKTPGRSGNAHPNIVPYDCFETGKGAVFLAVGNDGQFRKLCKLIECEPLVDDPRYQTNSLRNANRDSLRLVLEEAFQRYGNEELADLLIRNGVPCAPVLTVPEALSHPHTAHREMIVEFGGYRGIASPIKLGRTPARYRRIPPDFIP